MESEAAFGTIQSSTNVLDGGDEVEITDKSLHVSGSINIESSIDLLEQQQAREQARLLHRFRELRQWQLQQQEQLMKQQQLQLEGLRKEQMKVQTMLSKQRGTQWGAGKVIKPDGQSTPMKTPPRRHPQPAKSELISTMLALIPPATLDPSIDSCDPLALTVESQMTAPSLPRPIMYGAPPSLDGDNSTNPELFSNPGSQGYSQIDTENGVDDGVYPIPDTASEQSASTGSRLKFYPKMDLLQLLSEQDTNSVESPNALQMMLRTATPNTLKQMLGLMTQRVTGLDQPESMFSPSSPKTFNKQLHNQNVNCSSQVRHEVNLVNVEGELSPCNYDDFEEDSLDVDEKNISVVEKEQPLSHQLDDRPIKPGLIGKKSFEQLLEEQLKAEEDQLKSASTNSPSQSKRPFLRKGQGLARYSSRNKISPREEDLSNINKKSENKQSVVVETTSNHNPSQDFEKSNKPRKEHLTDSRASQAHTFRKSSNSSTNLQALSSKPKGSTAKTVEVESKKHKSSSKQIAVANQLQGSAIQPVLAKTFNGLNHSEKPNHDTETTDLFSDDSSFVVRVKEREENEQVELQELEEFELLEDFADNVSFCSNSSIVVKLLQKDQQKQQGTTLEAIRSAVRARKTEILQKTNSVQDKKLTEGNSQKKNVEKTEFPTQTDSPDNTLVDDNDNFNSSSDTLTESIDSDDSASETDTEGEEKAQNSQTKTDKQNIHIGDTTNEESSVLAHAGIVFTNKTGSDNHMTQNGGMADGMLSDNDVRSAVSLSPSKFMTRKIATKDTRFNDSADTVSFLQRLSAKSGSLHDFNLGTDYQENDGLRETRHAQKTFSSEKINAFTKEKKKENDHNYGSDEDASDESETEVKVQAVEMSEDFDFDDEEEWTDTAPKSYIKGDIRSSNKQESLPQGTPPTSRLVAKLFPKLKDTQQAKLAQQQQKEQEAMQKASQSTLGEGVQSKLLRDKLAQLDMEIEKFRNENSGLEKLRKEREESLSKLKQQITDFDKEKNEELKRLEEFKAQEIKKLKHEKKMFEKYQKAVRSMPDKKEREEIETLKGQVYDF